MKVNYLLNIEIKTVISERKKADCLFLHFWWRNGKVWTNYFNESSKKARVIISLQLAA
jgi:endo-beta-N-acetylglucosaminidase D